MSETNSVYIAWQDPDVHKWHVVGVLTQRGDGFLFRYTWGAYASKKFMPFSGMDDLKLKYFSAELFPLFKNRLLSRKRPEYPHYLQWLGLTDSEANPIDLLARSGGLRGTDNLQMFRRFDVAADGTFSHIMFAHGLAYLSRSAQQRVLELRSGEQLYFCKDIQNPHDPNALIVRAGNPAEIVGYCPRYLAEDLSLLLNDPQCYVKVYVEALAASAPENYKLMCKIKGQMTAELSQRFHSALEFQVVEDA